MSINECGQEKIILKSIRYIGGQPRINIVTIKKFYDNSIMLFIENGKNKNTGEKRTCSILLDKEDAKLLRKWLNV